CADRVEQRQRGPHRRFGTTDCHSYRSQVFSAKPRRCALRRLGYRGKSDTLLLLHMLDQSFEHFNARATSDDLRGHGGGEYAVGYVGVAIVELSLPASQHIVRAAKPGAGLLAEKGEIGKIVELPGHGNLDQR